MTLKLQIVGTLSLTTYAIGVTLENISAQAVRYWFLMTEVGLLLMRMDYEGLITLYSYNEYFATPCNLNI